MAASRETRGPRLDRRAARRRAGDAAGAVLRPRLRAGDHPVHGADVPPPDLVGPGPGPAGAGDAVVGVGRLRLADQRHRPRGGRGPPRHLRRDGGAADRLALRARGVRQPRPRSSRSSTASCGSPTSPSSCSPAPTTTRCATRCSASPPAPRSPSACWSRPRFLDGLAQGALWLLALILDMGGPYFFGSEGWKLVPAHFAERHGLIVIIALGESIVAIGVGAAGHVDGGDRGRGDPGGHADRGDVVDLLRRRRAGRRPAARPSRGRAGAQRDGPRLLLLPAPADGGRDRARRASA